MEEKKKQSGLGIAGFILSITGIFGILGFIFNIISIATSKKNNTKKGLPVAGIVINILYVIIIFSIILGSGADTTISEESKNMSESDFKSACVEISYEELFRNYDSHNGEKVKFTGEIQQVVYDGDYSAQYLISVTKDEYDYYSDSIYVTLDKSNVDTKFLEDDIVTFYGEASGTYSYTSVMGESIEVPQVNALYMELNK